MKNKFLLPYTFKIIGWVLTIPSIIGGILIVAENKFGQRLQELTHETFDEFVSLGLIFGMLLIAFSREKQEDEYINKVRLESFQMAVLINYLLLAACVFLFNGLDFLSVMTYNLFTVLLIFVIRFTFLVYRHNRAA